MSHKQAKRDRVQARINAEKQTINQQQNPQPITGKMPEGEELEKLTAILKEGWNEPKFILLNDSHSGFLVENWKQGWKWLSTQALMAIALTQAIYLSLPPEVIAQLPHNIQYAATLVIAISGAIGRFKNQSSGKKTEVLDGH